MNLGLEPGAARASCPKGGASWRAPTPSRPSARAPRRSAPRRTAGSGRPRRRAAAPPRGRSLLANRPALPGGSRLARPVYVSEVFGTETRRAAAFRFGGSFSGASKYEGGRAELFSSPFSVAPREPGGGPLAGMGTFG